MMNNQQAQTTANKDRLLKSFAVAGFITIIIIISWFAIQLVLILPTAFSSLASLAETVYNYKQPEITVLANKNSIPSGEVVTLSWLVPSQKGTFALAYTCQSGIVVEMFVADETRTLNCATHYNLGAISGADVYVYSELNRFADVTFTIDFLPINATEPTASNTRTVTIINTQIIDQISIDEVEIETPKEPTAPTPTSTTPAIPPKKYIQVPIYGIPVSNPFGNTDLSAQFVSLGEFSSSNNFLPSLSISHNGTGGIQFAVKNIGTKTSQVWAYIITLPNGQIYTSPKQTALKPNEKTVITIGFPMNSVSSETKTSSVAVTVIGDSNLTNNAFTTTIAVR